MMHAWGPTRPARPPHDLSRLHAAGLRAVLDEDREHWAEYLRMPDEARVVMSGGATPPCEARA